MGGGALQTSSHGARCRKESSSEILLVKSAVLTAQRMHACPTRPQPPCLVRMFNEPFMQTRAVHANMQLRTSTSSQC
eukprot:1232116-Prymnesium_polylepis.1